MDRCGDIKRIIEQNEIKRNISYAKTLELSKKFNLTFRELDLGMIKNNILPYRYSRNIKTLSLKHQLSLSTNRVIVIGCGGLGGYIIEELARIGVGHLTVVDGDVFEESNLNRQIGSTIENLGKPKPVILKERVAKINPGVEVTAICNRLQYENAIGLLTGHDLAIDALDNIEGRRILQDACNDLKIPFIHGAIGGWYLQITTVFPGENTLDKLYKDDQEKGIEKELGNPSFTPAMAASLQVAEAVKLLTGQGELLRNKVLFGDLLNMEFNTIEF